MEPRGPAGPCLSWRRGAAPAAPPRGKGTNRMGFPLRRRPEQEDDFVVFVASRRSALRATAYLLCGDWHLAEDLTQTTFTKMYLAWSRIERHEVLDQYARQVLVRAFLDERRRPWRRERPTEPDSAALDVRVHHDPDPGDPTALRDALLRLSERHRAV